MNRYREIEEKHKAERRELTDRVDQERLHSHPGDYMLAYGIGYIRMEDREKAFSMNARHRSELKDIIEEDIHGNPALQRGFLKAQEHYRKTWR